MPNKMPRIVFLAASLAWGSSAQAAPDYAQVLVTVGQQAVTAGDLHKAVSSSPFFTQFNSLDPDDQAVLRGDLLKRLVASRLLLQEAIAQGLDRTPAFRKEIEEYRKGLLYKHYMQKLRDGIALPTELEDLFKGELRDDPDARAAAKASYVAREYRRQAQQRVSELRQKYHVQTWEERIVPGISPETVLLKGDGGLEVRYGDLVDPQRHSAEPDPLAVESALHKRGELELIVKAAEESGMDVSAELNAFREERLPALLLEAKAKEWVPDEEVIADLYQRHPEYRKTADRWLAGQIVLKTRAEAEAVLARIRAGESLYRLAGELSIDPYGRSRDGDMGWLTQGQGLPQIEKALAKLDAGQVSDVIETPMGFHIVTLRERKPGNELSFATVRERIVQNVLSAKRHEYLQRLQQQYGVEWRVVSGAAKAAPGANGS